MNPRRIDLGAAAKQICVSQTSLRRLCVRRKDPVPHYRVGAKYVFDAAELEVWMERQKVKPRGRPKKPPLIPEGHWRDRIAKVREGLKALSGRELA